MHKPVRSDRWIALLLMGYSLAVLATLLVLHVQFTDDDGFYYFKIAQQLALGHGSTFDGIHVTNGYHPLWLLCLTPIFWLTPSPGAALLAGTIIQGILAAAAVGLLYAIARLTYGQLAAIMGALLWMLLTYRESLTGLEYSLHALLLLACAYVFLRWFAVGDPPRLRIHLALGLLSGLMFLARLETLALAGLIGLSLASRELRRGPGWTSLRRLLAFGTPPVIVVVGYVGFNLWLVGHPLPVSGVLKRAWSIELLAHDPRYLAEGWLAAKFRHLLEPLLQFYGGYVLSIWGGTFGAALFGRRNWWPFALYSLLQFAMYVGLYHDGLSFVRWYYVIQHFLTALLFASLVEWLATHLPTEPRHGLDAGRARYPGALLAGVAVSVGVLSIAWSIRLWSIREQVGFYQYPLRDAAEWARANLPADAVVGVWNAGTIAYLTQRRVINLDGVVNSWAYFETERFDLCTYWRRNGITYLLDAFDQRQAQSAVPTYTTYASCADQLKLIWSDQHYGTAWRMEAYRIGPPSR